MKTLLIQKRIEILNLIESSEKFMQLDMKFFNKIDPKFIKINLEDAKINLEILESVEKNYELDHHLKTRIKFFKPLLISYIGECEKYVR